MPFESLSFRHSFQLTNFPERWLPLIHLYDADLPLFPIYYFHATSKQLPQGQRPNHSDRVFGYVEKLNSLGGRVVEIHLITNKDLSTQSNIHYKLLAETEVKERIGINNPVTTVDVANGLQAPLAYANPVLSELWNRVVSDTYDNMLPFGRLWDEVLGLTRFVASWNSPGGRKGELIQTHYFSSKYGEPIQNGGGIPHIDFYLLPTINELLDQTNPLNIFPKYSELISVSDLFQLNNCTLVPVGNISLSKFANSQGGKFNTEKIHNLINSAYIPHNLRSSAIECFNTFDKGPQRTVIFFLMLSDLRRGRLNPATLSNTTLGSMYDGLGGTYQSPKVIHIYAQQSFGNTSAMPIDIWMETFFQWPLNLYKNYPNATKNKDVLSASTNLGKVERLLWVAAQARKVHSSACNDAIWCTKYASNRKPRGANPLACKICLASIRNVCPAYADIQNKQIVFNVAGTTQQFEVRTTSGNNLTPNQKFTSCKGQSIYSDIEDDFSPSDSPNGFAPYPTANHNNGSILTVEQFVATY
jgi:hypothetical protein